MLFNSVLIFGLSLASAVLAERHLKGIVLDASDEIINDIWAGVSKADTPGTVTWISGTFTVPIVSRDLNSSGVVSGGVVLVGIDGATCKSASLDARIIFSLFPNSEPVYHAGWSWASSGTFLESQISIEPGDRVTVEVAAHNVTSGLARIQNVTKNQTVTKDFQSEPDYSLCMQDAVWAVSRVNTNSPLANFGRVKFSGAVATGTKGQNYIPQDSKVKTWKIVDSNNASKLLTSVEIDDPESEGKFSITYTG